jgi:hypothetical protein
MLRSLTGRWLATSGLVVLMATVASAQQRGQGRGGPGAGAGAGGMGKVGLVQMPQVQEELKLDDDQKAKVGEIAASVREAAPRRGQDGETDRAEARERMQAFNRTVAEQEKKLDEVLKEDQQKRLNEILLQVAGPRSLVREDVASKLDLSGEQKQKIQALLREQREQTQREQTQRGEGQERPDPAAMRQRRQQMEQQLTAVLSDEQKQKWEELKGEPFQLQARRGGGGGGPQGQRRRPQN